MTPTPKSSPRFSALVSFFILTAATLLGCSLVSRVLTNPATPNESPSGEQVPPASSPGDAAFDARQVLASIPPKDDAEAAGPFLQKLDQALVDQTRQAAGVDQALGDQADEVYARMDRARAAALQKWVEDNLQSSGPRLQTVAWRIPEQTSPVIAQAQRIGFPQFIVALSPDGFADRVLAWDQKYDDEFPAGENGTEIEADGVKASLTVFKRMEGDSLVVDAKLTSSLPVSNPPGATLVETIQGTIRIQVCPDPSGSLQGSISIVAGSAIGSGFSGETKITSAISGQVNDEAELTGYTNQISASMRATGTSTSDDLTGLYGELQMEFTFDVSSSGERSITQAQGGEVRRSSKTPDSVINALMEKATDYIFWLDRDALKEAENFWRNGYCVEVIVLDPAGGSKSGVAPGSENPVTAEARHRRGGGEVKAPIEARMSEGETSVSPEGQRIPSPATFTYTAPPEVDKGATVGLRTVSNRGIGTGEAHFDTYLADYEITVKVSGSATEVDKYHTYSREIEAHFTMIVHPNSAVEQDGAGELRVAEVFTEPYYPCSSDVTAPATLHVFAGMDESVLVLSLRTEPIWMNANCWYGPVEAAPYFVGAAATIPLDGSDPAVTVFTQEVPFSSDGINLVLTWEVSAKRLE